MCKDCEPPHGVLLETGLSVLMPQVILPGTFPDASKAWLQRGLALSPLFGTVAQHSIDVIIAWVLMVSGPPEYCSLLPRATATDTHNALGTFMCKDRLA